MNMRYVRPLTEQQRALLESTIKNDASHRARMRAHGLVLSSEGITIKAIAKIYHVDRDTVATWIKKWEKHGEKSLHDQPRSGRPSTLNATEKELAKQYIQEEPRSLKHVVERLAQKTETRLSISSLKRLAKKARLRWKRVRKSLKRLRDLTVRPFLRRFRRNSTKPCIESQREAQYLQKTLLEWAQSGDVSIGLLAPFDDDGQGETLKRFEQAFGRRASRFAPGIPVLTSCPLCSLSRSLTPADTCQERQPPQGHRYQPEAPCGLVVSLQRHRCAGEGPPCEPPQAPLHLIGTARSQHRVRH